MLNAQEIQFIVDHLFVGNRLAAGEIKASNGMAIDLRNIRSPIVVFCSKGDNITPPQQALGWITDLYETDDDIRVCGQLSSMQSMKISATSAFSCPQVWPARNTKNSPPTSISSMSCRRGSTRRS